MYNMWGDVIVYTVHFIIILLGYLVESGRLTLSDRGRLTDRKTRKKGAKLRLRQLRYEMHICVRSLHLECTSCAGEATDVAIWSQQRPIASTAAETK